MLDDYDYEDLIYDQVSLVDIVRECMEMHAAIIESELEVSKIHTIIPFGEGISAIEEEGETSGEAVA